MSLKVLITGPFSTGKTNLIKALSERFTAVGIKIVILPDAARNCPLPLNEAQNDATSFWLIGNQIAREVEASAFESIDIVLCDRGIPDVLAHHEYSYGSLQEGKHFAAVKPFLFEWCSTYNLIFASTIDGTIPVVRDGVRSISEDYRRVLGDYSQKILAEIANVEVMPLGHEERIRFVLDEIQLRLKKSLGYS